MERVNPEGCQRIAGGRVCETPGAGPNRNFDPGGSQNVIGVDRRSRRKKVSLVTSTATELRVSSRGRGRESHSVSPRPLGGEGIAFAVGEGTLSLLPRVRGLDDRFLFPFLFDPG